MLAIRSATVVFPVPGIAGEGHMQRRNIGGQVHALANALDQQQRGNLADAGLDRLQADQLAIKLIEHLADTDLVEFPAQVDRLRRPRFARCLRDRLRVHLPP